jgi:histidyl-tRNA synthetase
VGIAFGLDRLHDVMEELGMGPQGAMADVFVTVFGADCRTSNLGVAHLLRQAGFNVEVALDANERLGKQFQTADRRGIRWAIVQGTNEIAAQQAIVRDLKNGDQHVFTLDALADGLRTLNTSTPEASA